MGRLLVASLLALSGLGAYWLYLGRPSAGVSYLQWRARWHWNTETRSAAVHQLDRISGDEVLDEFVTAAESADGSVAIAGAIAMARRGDFRGLQRLAAIRESAKVPIVGMLQEMVRGLPDPPTGLSIPEWIDGERGRIRYVSEIGWVWSE